MYKNSSSFVCYSTPSCVWHDLCTCAKQRLHVRGFAHTYTHVYTYMYILYSLYIVLTRIHIYIACSYIYSYIHTHMYIHIYIYSDWFMCYSTPSCVWKWHTHEFFTYTRIRTTNIYARIYWMLIYILINTHTYSRIYTHALQYSLMCEKTTHACVWNNSCICVKRLTLRLRALYRHSTIENRRGRERGSGRGRGRGRGREIESEGGGEGEGEELGEELGEGEGEGEGSACWSERMKSSLCFASNVVSGTCESRHICEWVTSHVWMSHDTRAKESRHLCEWVTSHMFFFSSSVVSGTYESRHTCKWVMLLTHTSCYSHTRHVTHIHVMLLTYTSSNS